MIRHTLTVVLIFFSSLLQAQQAIVASEKREEDRVTIYLENKGFAPYTVELQAIFSGLMPDRSLPVLVVVPPRRRVDALQLQAGFNRRWTYNYNFSYYLGDAIHAKHDDNYVYQLPFEKGRVITVGQGYDGAYSHIGRKALDFNLPEDTPVCAAREGTVIEVKKDSNTGCPHPSCSDQANYVLILHADGSIGNYVHLKHQGAVVKPGQKVQQGQIIGYSGNTGWSAGPHLHFEVFVPGLKNTRKTVTTFFRTAGSEKTLLEEFQPYSW